MSKKDISGCKDCKSFWPHGIKDGKHDRWCCHFGQPAPNVVSHCKLHNAKETK